MSGLLVVVLALELGWEVCSCLTFDQTGGIDLENRREGKVILGLGMG